MATNKLIPLYLLLLFLAGACNSMAPVPTITPFPTATASLMPTFTPTPPPTSTSTPSSTPTPNGQALNLLGMSLLAPLDWLVEVEEQESQTTIVVKEPETGIYMNIMSMKADPADDFVCALDFVQPLFEEGFSPMLKEIEYQEMEDLILQDGTTVPRSAMAGLLMGVIPHRFEFGVLENDGICYTFILSGEEEKLKKYQDVIATIYQSIEFVD